MPRKSDSSVGNVRVKAFGGSSTASSAPLAARTEAAIFRMGWMMHRLEALETGPQRSVGRLALPGALLPNVICEHADDVI